MRFALAIGYWLLAIGYWLLAMREALAIREARPGTLMPVPRAIPK